MSEIPLDNPIIVETTYTKFIIQNIDIRFNEPAIVKVQLLQDTPASEVINKTIIIPVEVYENWSYNQEQIISYVKTHIND